MDTNVKFHDLYYTHSLFKIGECMMKAVKIADDITPEMLAYALTTVTEKNVFWFRDYKDMIIHTGNKVNIEEMLNTNLYQLPFGYDSGYYNVTITDHHMGLEEPMIISNDMKINIPCIKIGDKYHFCSGYISKSGSVEEDLYQLIYRKYWKSYLDENHKILDNHLEIIEENCDMKDELVAIDITFEVGKVIKFRDFETEYALIDNLETARTLLGWS